jgi:hypothetical protein
MNNPGESSGGPGFPPAEPGDVTLGYRQLGNAMPGNATPGNATPGFGPPLAPGHGPPPAPGYVPGYGPPPGQPGSGPPPGQPGSGQQYGPPVAPPVSPLPAPPAGPGVRPPFVAPPTDGNRKRLWTGLITAGVIAVLLCGGGVAGFAALVTSTVDARRTAATKAVTEFLTDLQHDNFAGAYEAQCDELKQRLSFRAFTDEFSSSQLISFRLQEPEIETDSTIVPVQLTFTDGTQNLDRIVVVQDSDATYRVCGDE